MLRNNNKNYKLFEINSQDEMSIKENEEKKCLPQFIFKKIKCDHQISKTVD